MFYGHITLLRPPVTLLCSVIASYWSSSEADDSEQLADNNVDSDADELMSDVEPIPDSSEIKIPDLTPNGHVLIAAHGKKSQAYFVAFVMPTYADDETAEVSFLVQKGGRFTAPEKPDTSTVDIGDIQLLLPNPKMVGETEKTCKTMVCDIDLSSFF